MRAISDVTCAEPNCLYYRQVRYDCTTLEKHHITAENEPPQLGCHNTTFQAEASHDKKHYEAEAPEYEQGLDQHIMEDIKTLEADTNATSPVVTNYRGGKQSYVAERLDLVPPRAIRHVATILATGAGKYGEWNWKQLDAKDQINHALIHLYKHLEGDTSEDHIGNAACRILFYLEQQLESKL